MCGFGNSTDSTAYEYIRFELRLEGLKTWAIFSPLSLLKCNQGASCDSSSPLFPRASAHSSCQCASGLHVSARHLPEASDRGRGANHRSTDILQVPVVPEYLQTLGCSEHDVTNYPGYFLGLPRLPGLCDCEANGEIAPASYQLGHEVRV